MDQPIRQLERDAVGPLEAPPRLALATTRWVAARTPAPTAWPSPPMLTALGRGAVGRCPACGKSALFEGFLRVVAACPHCAAPLGQVRADDAPPYFVIFIVAHVVIGTQLLLEQHAALSMLEEAAILLPLTVGLAVGLLRPVKGATLGWMLKVGLVKQDDAP